MDVRADHAWIRASHPHSHRSSSRILSLSPSLSPFRRTNFRPNFSFFSPTHLHPFAISLPSLGFRGIAPHSRNERHAEARRGQGGIVERGRGSKGNRHHCLSSCFPFLSPCPSLYQLYSSRSFSLSSALLSCCSLDRRDSAQRARSGPRSSSLEHS